MMKSKSFSIALLVICFLFLILFPSPAVSKNKKVGCRRKSNSPPVTGHNKAILTLNSFEKGGDGGDPSECDGKYHSDKELIVALSTRWYKKGRRCGKYIYIFAKGKKVKARVVDECDSTTGWDAAHAGQPPCGTNIVDGSKAVWEALGVSPDIGTLPYHFPVKLKALLVNHLDVDGETARAAMAWHESGRKAVCLIVYTA